jgi:hypothetical protein
MITLPMNHTDFAKHNIQFEESFSKAFSNFIAMIIILLLIAFVLIIIQ